jgi:monovalent cation:H+ antiporter-2, CPA2 family
MPIAEWKNRKNSFLHFTFSRGQTRRFAPTQTHLPFLFSSFNIHHSTLNISKTHLPFLFSSFNIHHSTFNISPATLNSPPPPIFAIQHFKKNMHNFDFLGELALLCAVAIFIVLIFQRLKIPAVIGFIATGIVLGPSGLKVIGDLGLISTLAELGVVVLLFTIGLEFSVDELKRLKVVVGVGGSLQVVITSVVIALVIFFLLPVIGISLSLRESIFLGMALSIGSTAICLKILADRNELAEPHGRIALGILILQDIAIVPMMIGIKFLNPNETFSLSEIGKDIGLLTIFTIGLVIGFKLAMPRIVRLLMKIHAKEVLILGALLLCFGSAYLTSLAGLSLALGAFIAGMIISSSDDSHTIAHAIEPFRDAFTSIFFISVGLLLNVHWEEIPKVIGFAVVVLLIKAVLMVGIARLLHYPLRTSLLAGMALAQIGEFSFVLAEVGKQNGVISESVFQSMLAVIVVTMVVTPSMIALAPRVAEGLAPATEFIPLEPSFPDEPSLTEPASLGNEPTSLERPHVVIVGFGVNGQNIAAVLKATHISYVVIEKDAAVVASAIHNGENIRQGDGAEIAVLQKFGALTAHAIVIGIGDSDATTRAIHSVRDLNANAYIIARAAHPTVVESFYAAGASSVITEKLETAIQIFSLLLKRFDLPTELILEQQTIVRRDCAKLFPALAAASVVQPVAVKGSLG